MTPTEIPWLLERHGDCTLDLFNCALWRDDTLLIARLPRRELRILRVLLAHAGEWCTLSTLSARLGVPELSPESVKSVRQRLAARFDDGFVEVSRGRLRVPAGAAGGGLPAGVHKLATLGVDLDAVASRLHGPAGWMSVSPTQLRIVALVEALPHPIDPSWLRTAWLGQAPAAHRIACTVSSVNRTLGACGSPVRIRLDGGVSLVAAEGGPTRSRTIGSAQAVLAADAALCRAALCLTRGPWSLDPIARELTFAPTQSVVKLTPREVVLAWVLLEHAGRWFDHEEFVEPLLGRAGPIAVRHTERRLRDLARVLSRTSLLERRPGSARFAEQPPAATPSASRWQIEALGIRLDVGQMAIAPMHGLTGRVLPPRAFGLLVRVLLAGRAGVPVDGAEPPERVTDSVLGALNRELAVVRRDGTRQEERRRGAGVSDADA